MRFDIEKFKAVCRPVTQEESSAMSRAVFVAALIAANVAVPSIAILQGKPQTPSRAVQIAN